jgi:glutamyl-tRNA synthetase
MPSEKPVRVRIAPSPTGYLHIGTVRTALYNYLFARKEGGVFVVRIEDTDQSRSLPLYEEDILSGLRTLGLQWDEGPDAGGPHAPYRQSERTNAYQKYLQKLTAEGKAYKCFCSKEQLEEERKAMMAQGLAPKYGGTCRNLSSEQVAALEKEGKESVLRLRVPADYNVEFTDLIRGKITINSGTIGDIIIARSEAEPLYNFAVVADDADMRITHVIRGEDHISNTPKQILIQQALGLSQPAYAHLPLILSPDRSKLSKRSLETSFDEYLKDGYLPEALLNFIVLLGWHPEGDEEILSLADMVEKFSIRRVQKAGAVFDMKKLDWFNAQYIRRMPAEELVERVKPFVPESWLEKPGVLSGALALEKERIQKLSEFPDLAAFFFDLPVYDAELLRWQDAPFEKTLRHLEKAKECIAAGKDIMAYAEQQGRGEVLWPLRVALSGQKNSPGPLEILSVLGKQESTRRIDGAIQKIHATV